MAMSYKPQVAQVNEKLYPNSSLDLTLTQYFHDEDPEPQDVRPHLEVEPPQAWYDYISPNYRTLMILLQVNPTFSDELEIIYEGYYKIEDTSIFAWSSISSIGHFCMFQFVDCLLITRRTT
jgi:hypothetical protein